MGSSGSTLPSLQSEPDTSGVSLVWGTCSLLLLLSHKCWKSVLGWVWPPTWLATESGCDSCRCTGVGERPLAWLAVGFGCDCCWLAGVLYRLVVWVAARLGFYSCGVDGCKAGFLLLYVSVWRLIPWSRAPLWRGSRATYYVLWGGSLLWGGFGAHWLGWAIWVEWVIRQMPGLGELLKG